MWKPQAGKLQVCLMNVIFTDQIFVASEPESHSVVARENVRNIQDFIH